MSRIIKLTWLWMAFILLGLTACGGATPTTDPSLAFTKIWETVAVAQTSTALAASPTPSMTYTPAISLTSQPTNTPLITNTLLPGVPSATAFTISTPVSTRSTTNACDNANFVSDVTIPDGSEVAAGSTFVKTWKFKNIGPCTWLTSYDLVYSYVSDSGKDGVFKPPARVDFPNKVLPGEEVEISVTLTAPTKAAAYQVVFVLQNDKGYNIPLVNENSYEFYVLFVVK